MSQFFETDAYDNELDASHHIDVGILVEETKFVVRVATLTDGAGRYAARIALHNTHDGSDLPVGAFYLDNAVSVDGIDG